MSPRRRILPIFVPHAGCPNDCVFCDQKRISGSPLAPSPEEIARRLAALPDGADYELAYYGGSFTALPGAEQEALLSAAASARARGAVGTLRVSTRPDAVDETVLRRLLAWGVETVELGAQSMDDAVLAASGRGHSARDTERAAELVKAAGLRLILQMMTGLPGSGPESDLATARRLIALGPEGTRIYPTVILAGTALERLWREGRYREHSVEEAVALCARLVPLFEEAGVSVIRLGLNPTDSLSAGEAVGGAYHPALGELVRARIWRERAETLLSAAGVRERAALGVHPRHISALIGQHRENLAYFRETLGLKSLRALPRPEAGEGLLLLPEEDASAEKTAAESGKRG